MCCFFFLILDDLSLRFLTVLKDKFSNEASFPDPHPASLACQSWAATDYSPDCGYCPHICPSG